MSAPRPQAEHGPSLRALNRTWLAASLVLALVITTGGAWYWMRSRSAAESQFTIAVVPDTQEEVVDGNALLSRRYEWLTENSKQLNLKFVVHIGDVVNWGVQDPSQFTRADESTSILDRAQLPYAYAIGNHDTAAVTVGGGAAPGSTRQNLRNTAAFNSTFPVSRFRDVGGVFAEGKVDNMFQTFTAGDRQWLVLTLEMWPRQQVIDWAKQVVATHPAHSVIINTHAFVNGMGQLATEGNYGDVNAQGMWDQLVSQYPNVRMVLSGHYGPGAGQIGAWYGEATGVHGNRIAEVMTAYHSAQQNQVRLLTIDTDDDTMTSKIYVSHATSGAPTGWISDAYSNIKATGMNWVSGNQ